MDITILKGTCGLLKLDKLQKTKSDENLNCIEQGVFDLNINKLKSHELQNPKSCTDLNERTRTRTRTSTHRPGKKRRQKRHTLFVVRFNSVGQTTNSRPCHHCLQQLKQCGLIKRVVFSNATNEIESESIRTVRSEIVTSGYRFENRKTFERQQIK